MREASPVNVDEGAEVVTVLFGVADILEVVVKELLVNGMLGNGLLDDEVLDRVLTELGLGEVFVLGGGELVADSVWGGEAEPDATVTAALP